MSHRLVTNGDILEFIEAGGYNDFRFWLDDGWNACVTENWQGPLYWRYYDGQWFEITVNGLQPINKSEPVSHVSFFEADAYARWNEARLPTEAEWEVASQDVVESPGNFLEHGRMHPQATDSTQLTQMLGDVWEHTLSAYLPYPGYQPLSGALGEYNGKFMNGQRVLRGGCAVTPARHIRNTYRNFFYPQKRWPMTGFRLARSLTG